MQTGLLAGAGEIQGLTTYDINGDGRLTFADLLVLSSNFPKAADAVYADGDLNCDGRISFADLLSLAGEFQ